LPCDEESAIRSDRGSFGTGQTESLKMTKARQDDGDYGAGCSGRGGIGGAGARSRGSFAISFMIESIA
jgi:hypothetical protein